MINGSIFSANTLPPNTPIRYSFAHHAMILDCSHPWLNNETGLLIEKGEGGKKPPFEKIRDLTCYLGIFEMEGLNKHQKRA